MVGGWGISPGSGLRVIVSEHFGHSEGESYLVSELGFHVEVVPMFEVRWRLWRYGCTYWLRKFARPRFKIVYKRYATTPPKFVDVKHNLQAINYQAII